MKLLVPESYLASVEAFIKDHNLSIEAITTGQGDVCVETAETLKETCTAEKLYLEGRIPCPIAFKLAEKLGIPRRSVGPLLDLFKIKIKACQLGCFK